MLLPNMTVVVLIVMPVLEPAQTPIQKLLETVADGDVPEADGGFCKEGIFCFFMSPLVVVAASMSLLERFHVILGSGYEHETALSSVKSCFLHFTPSRL